MTTEKKYAESPGYRQMVADAFGSRFWDFLYDYICMKAPGCKRHRELSAETLICRFCTNKIELLGAWKCDCGYSRPGNYFGRCPNCLARSRYIDCPACGFTMDVR